MYINVSKNFAEKSLFSFSYKIISFGNFYNTTATYIYCHPTTLKAIKINSESGGHVKIKNVDKYCFNLRDTILRTFWG